MLADHVLAEFGGVAARHLFHRCALAEVEVTSMNRYVYCDDRY